ncbi:MAG: hypothetical protein K0R51_2361 [Cytophagaceae bacterium]|jgi:hypothetical protein|nr:hypothetical protein [Cytophagaceae bacterium]
MAAIDQYQHLHLGFIECPSTANFGFNNPTRKIAIYELLESIPNTEQNFDGKVGDIILGGGSGEAPAFRIAIPESIQFWTQENYDDWESYHDLFKAFWTPTESYILCEGYTKIGWIADNQIENWLAENLSLLLIEHIDKYSNYKTHTKLKSKLTYSSTK